MQLLGRNPRTLWPFLTGAGIGWLFSSTPLSNLRLPSFVLSLLGALHPVFDVEPPSAIALQRQRRVLEAQRRLGVRGNQGNRPGPAGQGFRDQLLPGAGGGLGGMLPPHMAAAPPSEDAIQQLMVRVDLMQCLVATGGLIIAVFAGAGARVRPRASASGTAVDAEQRRGRR